MWASAKDRLFASEIDQYARANIDARQTALGQRRRPHGVRVPHRVPPACPRATARPYAVSDALAGSSVETKPLEVGHAPPAVVRRRVSLHRIDDSSPQDARVLGLVAIGRATHAHRESCGLLVDPPLYAQHSYLAGEGVVGNTKRDLPSACAPRSLLHILSYHDLRDRLLRLKRHSK